MSITWKYRDETGKTNRVLAEEPTIELRLLKVIVKQQDIIELLEKELNGKLWYR